MVIGIKDSVKIVGISVIACCAVFVCTLFLNYNLDLSAIEEEITTSAGIAMYEAQVSMGKVTCAVTGGCLAATSVVMLLFYVKNYIDTHGKELGILKALGYSDMQTARHFWVFGMSVFAGCVLGFAAAFLYLPTFYRVQNAEKLFPELSVRFHPGMACLLTFVPAVIFSALSVVYAYVKLREPVMGLIRERQAYKQKIGKGDEADLSFLVSLKKSTLRGKKTLVFFVSFSAFCFSAMTQMSMSMNDLASETFAFMIISIGLILAFMTLFLSLTSVVKDSAKTIAMMRVFGYAHSECTRAILGGYRPVSYLGFAVGTVYQYALLKMVMTFVFSGVDMPEYSFDFTALAVSFVAFIAAYEAVMYGYSVRIKKMSVKSIMLE